MPGSKPFSASRRSIKLDKVNPRDFLRHSLIYACEQCSHFAPEAKSCTLGFLAEIHLREAQLQRYELTGRMAFCRFLEID